MSNFQNPALNEHCTFKTGCSLNNQTPPHVALAKRIMASVDPPQGGKARNLHQIVLQVVRNGEITGTDGVRRGAGRAPGRKIRREVQRLVRRDMAQAPKRNKPRKKARGLAGGRTAGTAFRGSMENVRKVATGAIKLSPISKHFLHSLCMPFHEDSRGAYIPENCKNSTKIYARARINLPATGNATMIYIMPTVFNDFACAGIITGSGTSLAGAHAFFCYEHANGVPTGLTYTPVISDSPYASNILNSSVVSQNMVRNVSCAGKITILGQVSTIGGVMNITADQEATGTILNVANALESGGSAVALDTLLLDYIGNMQTRVTNISSKGVHEFSIGPPPSGVGHDWVGKYASSACTASMPWSSIGAWGNSGTIQFGSDFNGNYCTQPLMCIVVQPSTSTGILLELIIHGELSGPTFRMTSTSSPEDVAGSSLVRSASLEATQTLADNPGVHPAKHLMNTVISQLKAKVLPTVGNNIVKAVEDYVTPDRVASMATDMAALVFG
jgi:hypothetical protein